MDKIEVTKKIVRLIVTTSVSGTVVTMIHAGTPVYTNAQKVKVYIGAYVIGAIVSDKCGDYTDKQIDAIVKVYKELTTTDSNKS